ncbi:uncharacterized protein C8Q71DRAFT_712299 [Rhodofomes roseus]|uniref:NADH dehydrogenase [ubiquinone] 1 beta subcomplex subunit 9 n=1 Tax=Rhodofomes roseus TaxID=34475 RepID=A0ABQ8K9C4_9APHY|nr:uncharacterized protein C8Q71DRAFT_712299 [Rhodofomes roseus]KAH9833694.1 hypothetical protein C8Q71DRAFT_712299 [Rhodofomes roseus]
MSVPSPFTTAHRKYVQGLYRRYLNNELNWHVSRDVWRGRAIAVRAEFERNRNVHDPRELAVILQKAEADLAERLHPDPYRRECWQLTSRYNRLTAMQRPRPSTERNGICCINLYL